MPFFSAKASHLVWGLGFGTGFSRGSGVATAAGPPPRRQAPRRSSLASVLSATPRWPEELWLQAYVANHDASHAASLARGPLSSVAVGQLCWRGKSHFPPGDNASSGLRRIVDGIRDGSLRDARPRWFASKVPRGLHEPVTRYVLGLP